MPHDYGGIIIMIWGTFSPAHIISLIFAALVGFGLHFLLKHRSDRTQTIVLGILSFSGIVAIIYNLLAWNSPLEYLPFHLCSLGAVVLPIAVFTKNKVLSNLLLLWSLGSYMALLLNYAVAEAELFSPVFCFFYFPHVLECVIPILLFTLKRSSLDARCTLSTVLITFTAFTVIHFINLGLNAYCMNNEILDYAGNIIQVNYMYSIVPENPLLALFYSIVPYPYWYMLLCLPVAAVYLGVIYGVHGMVKKMKSK